MGPIWHSRRVQRSAFFAFIFIASIALFAYGGDNLPSPSSVWRSGSLTKGVNNNNTISDTVGPEVEPLYTGQEYDPNHMPEVPDTIPTGHEQVAIAPGLDPTRIALIIETRPAKVLPTLISHFIATLPSAWVVKLVGSQEAFSVVNKSFSLRQHLASQKFQFQEIPAYWPVSTSENVSQTLTNITFYSEFLAPAEWALFFQTDSIICAASEESIDDWVDKGYDWVGAPWNNEGYGGNGGLSLRHIPPIVELLKNETRMPGGGGHWEDVWICDRLKNAAPAEVETKFSVESIYAEKPFGYHLRGSGKLVHAPIWGNDTLRREIFEYCPETKILFEGLGLKSKEELAKIKADAEKAKAKEEKAKAEKEKANADVDGPKTDAEAARAGREKKIAQGTGNYTTTVDTKAGNGTDDRAARESIKKVDSANLTTTAATKETSSSSGYADS